MNVYLHLAIPYPNYSLCNPGKAPHGHLLLCQPEAPPWLCLLHVGSLSLLSLSY